MNMLCVPVGPLQANCYLVWDGERRACAVDPGGEPERLAELVLRKELVLDAILVTHGHFDHTEGVADLANVTGAAVYCSEAVAPVLASGLGCSATGLPIPATGDKRLTVVSDGWKLTVGDLSVQSVATPGHTPGDVTYDIDGSLFCGDLLFCGSVGRTDFAGGDFDRLLASVEHLVKSYPAETRVYPGHMEATTLGRELQHNPFLVKLRSHG
jgi:hydroxyacylglutathione hydrolase